MFTAAIRKGYLNASINPISFRSYSGSMYPGVPARPVDIEGALLSIEKALDNPKSAIFACMFSVNKTLEGFRSLWTMGGLQPLCR